MTDSEVLEILRHLDRMIPRIDVENNEDERKIAIRRAVEVMNEKIACKPENRPSDDGKTSRGLDIPESPNDDWNRWKNSVSQKEFEALAELVDSIHDWAVEELIDLNGRVKIIEARVRELEARLSPVDTKSGE